MTPGSVAQYVVCIVQILHIQNGRSVFPGSDAEQGSVSVLSGAAWLIPITDGEETRRQPNAIRCNTNISLRAKSGEDEEKHCDVSEGRH